MRFPFILCVALLASSSALAGCQSSPASDPVVVHHFNDRMTIIEHADTLTLLLNPVAGGATTKADTSIFLRLHDSSMVQLRGHGPKKVDPRYARVLHKLVVLAKAQEETEKKTGFNLHN